MVSFWISLVQNQTSNSILERYHCSYCRFKQYAFADMFTRCIRQSCRSSKVVPLIRTYIIYAQSFHNCPANKTHVQLCTLAVFAICHGGMDLLITRAAFGDLSLQVANAKFPYPPGHGIVVKVSTLPHCPFPRLPRALLLLASNFRLQKQDLPKL